MDTTKDPREMRKAIDATIRKRFGDDSEFNYSESLIRAVDSAAYHLGWSGEDRMTAIAYIALLKVEELTKMAIDDLNASPRPIVLRTPSTKEQHD